MTKVRSFGNYIRTQRELQGLLLREVASQLGMDTPMLSKIERGLRPLKREKLRLLSKILDADEGTLITLWLAEKIYDTLADEDYASQALRVAEDTLTYRKTPKKKKKP